MSAHSTRTTPALMLARLGSTTLLWALIASGVVHAGFIAVPFLARAQPGSTRDASTRLQALIMAPSLSDQSVMAVAVPSPVSVAAKPESPPIALLAPAATRPSPDQVARARTGGMGDLDIEAQPLEDRDRLGDLATRQLNEFPAELDNPPALDGKIQVRYPPAALAEGREESVVAWVVVNAQGEPEEIAITEGSEEFAEAVRAALKDARFQPARNFMKPVRFPIALEFRFAFDRGAPAGAAAADTAR